MTTDPDQHIAAIPTGGPISPVYQILAGGDYDAIVAAIGWADGISTHWVADSPYTKVWALRADEARHAVALLQRRGVQLLAGDDPRHTTWNATEPEPGAPGFAEYAALLPEDHARLSNVPAQRAARRRWWPFTRTGRR